MLGGKEDYDKSIHEPVDMTFADVTTIASAMKKDKDEYTTQMYELFVIHVATRQWQEAQSILRLIGLLEGYFPLDAPSVGGTTK
jgi:tRNA(Phe) wybutosine-synthesizing methylase Tyw3